MLSAALLTLSLSGTRPPTAPSLRVKRCDRAPRFRQTSVDSDGAALAFFGVTRPLLDAGGDHRFAVEVPFEEEADQWTDEREAGAGP